MWVAPNDKQRARERRVWREKARLNRKVKTTAQTTVAVVKQFPHPASLSFCVAECNTSLFV